MDLSKWLYRMKRSSCISFLFLIVNKYCRMLSYFIDFLHSCPYRKRTAKALDFNAYSGYIKSPIPSHFPTLAD